MNLSKSIVYLLLVLLIVSCGSTTDVLKDSEKYSFVKQPNHLYFTVLQLNDVYEIAPIQGGDFGGMARVETVHKALLKENPNTMIVLAGDFLNPSLLGAIKYHGEKIKGKQMVDVMNVMQFDLVAFGNHEFDLTYNQLQERLNQSDFDWVSANVLHNNNGQAYYFHKIKNGKRESTFDSYVRTIYDGQNKKSAKIGFISVCIPSNTKDYVTYSDALIEAERSYNEVENKADIVVGLTHLDIEQDRKLAKLLPNLSIIMGGHEHKNNYETIGNVKIAKADANAKTVYIHRFDYNPATKKTKVKSQLLTIGKSIPEDLEVAKVVSKWQTILDKSVRNIVANPYEVIYNAKVALDGTDTPSRSKQTNLGDIITKSMSQAYNDIVDCAIVNGGSIRIDDKLKGDITAIDIFRVLPYGGSIYKTKIKGGLLKEVLNFGENAKGNGAYLQRYNVSQKGNNWVVKGKAIDNNKVYTIATSDYLLKGLDIPMLKEGKEGVLEVYKPKKSELTYDIRKAIVSYLKKQN